MLNQKSIQSVNNSQFSRSFVKPLYESYCFSRIPGTIKQLLGIDNEQALPSDVLIKPKAKKVVFLFIDSFGWEFWEKHHDRYPFLQRFIKEGIVSKLTSQFPSTTSAHVTTIHTGLPVGESGVYEWFYYEPKVDAIIAPLLFSYAGEPGRDGLKKTAISPQSLFPTQTIYKTLKERNIQSFIVQYQEYTPSTYSDVVFDGADAVIPYRDLVHGLVKLREAVLSTSKSSYFFFYYSNIDTTGHIDGPNTPTHQAQIQNLFTALEDIFFQAVKNEPDLTILLSADHGTMGTPLDNTFYVNQELPTINPWMKVNALGQVLAPAGSCRDLFLHIQPDKIKQAVELINEAYKGRGEAYATAELIQQGFFGANISPELNSRIGDVVVLPYSQQAAWWYEKDKFSQNNKGNHGGLSKEEMEIPFLNLST